MENDVKKVPLDAVHRELGAKIIPFAGFDMPVRYSSDKQEHLCVRENVGIFDVSHMGEFRVTGEKSLPFLQYVTSNDVSKLAPGKVQYSCLPNHKGGIVDDLLVYMVAEHDYFLVVNAANIQKDWDWLQENNALGADMENVSEQYCLFAVQGPKASEVLQSLTDIDLVSMTYYTFEIGSFAGVDEMIVSATGYTGAGGFELYVPAEHGVEVWEKIMTAGAGMGIQPIGLGARDTLRLEKGYCLYGNDIDDTTSPLEAGLGWITKFSKEFINSEALEAQKTAGVDKKLVGFEIQDKGIPRAGYNLLDADGEIIGNVTSGSISPSLGKGIGLGYVPTDYAKPDSEVYVEVRGKSLKAKVIKLPFL